MREMAQHRNWWDGYDDCLSEALRAGLAIRSIEDSLQLEQVNDIVAVAVDDGLYEQVP